MFPWQCSSQCFRLIRWCVITHSVLRMLMRWVIVSIGSSSERDIEFITWEVKESLYTNYAFIAEQKLIRVHSLLLHFTIPACLWLYTTVVWSCNLALEAVTNAYSKSWTLYVHVYDYTHRLCNLADLWYTIKSAFMLFPLSFPSLGVVLSGYWLTAKPWHRELTHMHRYHQCNKI